jgi:peptide/nickel transport system substrate-binding protein
MKQPFRRAKFIFLLAAFGFLFFTWLIYRSNEPAIAANGDRYYGGVFSYSLPESFNSLFPLETNALSELRIISQLFDPLVKQTDSKGTIENYLAKEIQLKKEGRVVYIKLRKGVLFHPDDCFSDESRELSADDVAFTLSVACSNNPLNQSSSLLMGKILGSETYFKNAVRPEKSYVSGIHVINKFELEIQLTRPYNNIKQLLAHPSLGILSKVSWGVYGKTLREHPIGSGPFYIKSTSNSRVELARNENYWKRDRFENQLPYLDEVRVYTNTRLSDEFPMFSSEKIDLLFDLPVTELEKAFGTLTDAKKGKNLLHRVHIQKASKIHYLAWNLKKPPFNNSLVRKALSLALDKNAICSDVLRGDGQPINQGFIPKSDYYSNTNLPITSKNIVLARQYLKQAGYSINRPFPIISFYVNAQQGSNAGLWCKEVCRQLNEALGINLKLLYVDTKTRDKKIKTGKALLWKAGWVGDYPDAESYLRLFYKGYQENTYGVKFHNDAYDRLYLKSILTTNMAEKRMFQQACEAIVAKESAIIPIYSEDFFVMINLRVRGFNMNPSGIIDFSQIYLKTVQK